MSDDAEMIGAIRALLDSNNVPTSGFIDDHVRNCIAQRNILTEALRTMKHFDPKFVDAMLAKAYPAQLRSIGHPLVKSPSGSEVGK